MTAVEESAVFESDFETKEDEMMKVTNMKERLTVRKQPPEMQYLLPTASG